MGVPSAFSNAGQRCAAGSRIIVFDQVYDAFVEKLIAAAKAQKVGPTDDDDFGPVINKRQLNAMLGAIDRAKQEGARVLAGGKRLTDAARQRLLSCSHGDREAAPAPTSRATKFGRLPASTASAAMTRRSHSPTIPFTGSPPASTR